MIICISNARISPVDLTDIKLFYLNICLMENRGE